MDGVGFAPPPLGSRPAKVAAGGQAQRPVECDPAHRLGLGEVHRIAAHLPDPGVGLAPDLAHEVGHLANPPSRVRVEAATSRDVEPGRLQVIAIDVELDLVRSAVADANGRRAPVALEVKRPFPSLGPSVEAIQNLQPRMREL